MSKLLATYPRSTGQGEWRITESDDGVVYCNCPAWRFQKVEPEDRGPCKHLVAYNQTIKTPDFDHAMEEATNAIKQLTGEY